jgi:hypothetical protein
MRVSWAKLLALSYIYEASQGSPVQVRNEYQLQPFHIDLSSRVPRMLDQIKGTQLPAQPVYINTGTSAGISLSLLESFRTEWLTSFDWNREQEDLNKYVFSFDPWCLSSIKSFNRFNHYTAVIEGLKVHFIHETSKAKDAIPLLLVHGWPGSFLEFAPVINELTKEATTTTGKKVSFDVVVASIPGFAFSSAPPVNWTVADTARVFNTLLTNVLCYDTYATFGTDWGSGIAYSMYDQFNTTVRALSLDFLPFHPYTSDQLAAENITLSSLEEFEQAEATEWNNSGEGYFVEQTTKVCTLEPRTDHSTMYLSLTMARPTQSASHSTTTQSASLPG